jgi:hypothetical protein
MSLQHPLPSDSLSTIGEESATLVEQVSARGQQLCTCVYERRRRPISLWSTVVSRTSRGFSMSHVFELTDEQYETLRQVAARDQETPEQLLSRMVDALTTTHGTIYYTDDELLRALGADDEELGELAQLETDDHADE